MAFHRVEHDVNDKKDQTTDNLKHYGRISEMFCCVKEARHKRIHFVSFHLHDFLEQTD